MLGSLVKGLSTLFGGSKADRDMKEFSPRVSEIIKHFESYSSLSDQGLREKTLELKAPHCRISERN